MIEHAICKAMCGMECVYEIQQPSTDSLQLDAKCTSCRSSALRALAGTKSTGKPVFIVEGIEQQHPQGAIGLASGAGHLLNDSRQNCL